MRVVICFLLILQIGHAQDSQVLGYEEYIQQVLMHHPLAKQAQLLEGFSEAEQLKAKALIDPKLFIQNNNKDFKQKEYYRLIESKLEWPTIAGLKLKAGYENNEGDYLNPENYTSGSGLWAAGIEADVFQIFGFNEQRAAKEQANVFQSLNENQQELMLNQLVLQATEYYINWFKNYQELQTIEQSVMLSQTYVANTEQLVALGDKADIELTEAKSNWLEQQVKWQEQAMAYIQSKYQANQLLWNDSGLLTLAEYIVPRTIEIEATEALIQQDNPLVREKQLKVDEYDIQYLLAKRQNRPELTLGYSPLFATHSEGYNTQVNTNYKYGISFAMPLFRRKTRAKVLESKTKTAIAQSALMQKMEELDLKRQLVQQLIEQYAVQQEQQKQFIASLKQLLDAEEIKYGIGESSVFLLNKRQEKLLKAQLKSIALEAKQNLKKAELLYLTNQMR